MYSRDRQYKSATEYYQTPVSQPTQYSRYEGPKEKIIPDKSDKKADDKSPIQPDDKKVHLKWKTTHHVNTSDPAVWGPSMWFTLHNGASKYPVSATDFYKDRMKEFILSIPIMLPCSVCKDHANKYIDDARTSGKLDEVIGGRDKLFKWFVDFHNMVNKTHNKPIFSYEEAYDIYNNGATISTLSYE